MKIRGGLIMLLALIAIAILGVITPTSSVLHELKLFALPVGQGDCTVVVCPEDNGRVVIMDMGSSKPAWTPAMVTEFLSQRINGAQSLYDRVSTIIISHGDKDHYNYINHVFPSRPPALQDVFLGGNKTDYTNAGPVVNSGKVLNNGTECRNTDCYDTGFNENLCDSGGLDAPVFRIEAANLGKTKNAKSIVLRISYHSKSALLVGDLNTEYAVNKLVEYTVAGSVTLASTYYKISHHGASSHCNQQRLLDQIKPDFAFASAYYSPKNKYGHIVCEVIDRLLDTPSTRNVKSLDEATRHVIHCGKNPWELRNVTKAIWTTMPVNGSVGIIAINMNGDNSKPFIDSWYKLHKYGSRTLLKDRHRQLRNRIIRFRRKQEQADMLNRMLRKMHIS